MRNPRKGEDISSATEKNPRTGEEALSSTLMAKNPPSNSTNQALKTSVSSSFVKVVCLGDWWLVKSESSCNGKRLAVGGLTSGWNHAKRVFHSLPIIKRHDAFTLETTDGITVMIQGLINRARAHQNGFPPEVCNKFLTGFPFNWEVYVDQYFGKESVGAPTRSSLLNEFSTPIADNASSELPICLDEVPTSTLRDHLISTHGSSDNDMLKGDIFSAILGNCSGNASKNPTIQKDSDMRSIPFLMEAYLLKESPTKHDGDRNRGDIFEGIIGGQSSGITKNAGPEESRKILLSKELENLNHGSCGCPVNEVSRGNSYMDNSESPSIDDLKYRSLQMTKRFISQCKVGKDMQKEEFNKHEMENTCNLLNISKGRKEESQTIISAPENENCPFRSLSLDHDFVDGVVNHIEEELSDRLTLNAGGIGCKDVQGELLPQESDLSNHKSDKNNDKKSKSSLKSGSTKFCSVSVSGDYGIDRVSHVTEKLSDPKSSNAANVGLGGIVLESLSVDTSDGLRNDSEEIKNCIKSPTFQTGDMNNGGPPLSGEGMLKETPTMSTFDTIRTSARLRNLRSNQKENQTSDHIVNNENILNSTSVACISQNDGSRCKLNVRSKSNSSNLGISEEGKDLYVTKRDDGCHKYDKVLGNTGETGCFTGVDLEATVQTCDDGKDGAVSSMRGPNISKETLNKFEARRLSQSLKIAKNNLQGGQMTERSAGIEKNDVSAGNCAATRRSMGIEKNEVTPRNFANNVGPEGRERLILTETDERHLECGQGPINEVQKMNLSAGSVAMRGETQVGSDDRNIIPSGGKVETSEVFLCKSDARRSSSRLKNLKNSQGNDQTMKSVLQIEKREDLVNYGTTNIEHNFSGESASDQSKVLLEERIPESSSEEIANSHHKYGLQVNCLSSQRGVDTNVQKGSNLSVNKLKRNDKAKGSSQKTNVKKPENTSYTYQSFITRDRAKKLSFASPESLNFKRSRSGRLLVPPLANWRNQQIIYDSEGKITGISLGLDQTLSPPSLPQYSASCKNYSGSKQGGDPAVRQKLKRRRGLF